MSKTVNYILNVATKKAERAMKGLSGDAKRLDSQFMTTTKSIGRGMAMVGAAVVAAAGATVAFGQKMADLANNLADTATKTGLTTDTIAGLKLAAEGSGLSLGSLTQGLLRFQSSMAESAEGTGKAAEAFAKLGISATDGSGSLRDANSVFLEVTDALAAMGNETERNATLIDLFGQRAGPALIQSGALGSMQEFAAFAKEFGVNMDLAGGEAAAFQRSMAELTLVIDGTLSNILQTITGTTRLSDAIDKVAEGVVFFGAIFGDVFEMIKAIGKAATLPITNLNTNLRNTVFLLEAIVTGNFEGIKTQLSNIVDNGFQMAETFMDAGQSILDLEHTLERAGFKVEKFAEKQAEFRKSISGQTGATGAGGGQAGGAAETAAAALGAGMFKGLEGIMVNSATAFGEFTEEITKAAKIIERIPRELNMALKLFPAMLRTSMVVNAASGPEAAVRAIGDGFSKLTLGLSEIFSDIVLGIVRIGEKKPQELRKEMDAFIVAFEKGLERLPDILVKVLPRFIVGLSIAILKGLLKLPVLLAESIFEALQELFGRLKKFLREIFTREGRQEKRARARRRGELTNFEKFLVLAGGGSTSEFTSNFMSGGIMQAQSGMRFTGAKRGLAMLHEGEAVIPASGRAGQAEQRFMGGSGGNGINIVINSAVVENRAIDELVRKLETRFGNFGVGKSTLFGR